MLAAAVFREENVNFYFPHGAFYMMADISCCRMDSEKFALKLLADEHVAVAREEHLENHPDRWSAFPAEQR